MTGSAATPDNDVAEFDRLMALEHGDEPAATPPDPSASAAPSPAAAQGEQGAAAPVAGEGEGGGTANEPAGDSASDEDKWLEGLPEDVRTRITAERSSYQQKVKDAEDRFNALHGKLAPTQRALSEAQQRLAQLPAQQAPAATPPVQAAGQSAVDFFDTPEWKQWAEDFPGDAKVMRLTIERQQAASQQMVAGLEARLNQIAQRLDQTEQVASRVVVNDEITRLESKHPDWRQVNESDDFWSWFDEFRASQPKSIRSMYYDNAQLEKMFNDAEFNIGMLDSYKASRAAAQQQAAPPVQQVAPNSTQPVTPPAQSVRQSMAVAPAVRGSGSAPAAVPLDSLTPAQQFEHLWNNT